jgi:hypothetical protein
MNVERANLDLLILALMGSAALIHKERRVSCACGAIAFLGVGIILKLFPVFCVSLAARFGKQTFLFACALALPVILQSTRSSRLSTRPLMELLYGGHIAGGARARLSRNACSEEPSVVKQRTLLRYHDSPPGIFDYVARVATRF